MKRVNKNILRLTAKAILITLLLLLFFNIKSDVVNNSIYFFKINSFEKYIQTVQAEDDGTSNYGTTNPYSTATTNTSNQSWGSYIANAGLSAVGWAVATVLGTIAYVITAVIGLIITVLVQVLIQVAQYGNIIDTPTVINGWVIIRDICNMGFVIAMLVIAFGTILRQNNYSVRMLPKLLLMAVLINFSRTIFGLIIDVSQVIMLTFVNAFKDGGGWFINMFNVQNWFNMPGEKINFSQSNAGANQWSIVMSIIASVIAAILTLIVIAVIVAVLVARIVMLWIYTIFSPLVFLGWAFPPVQRYSSRIWSDFINNVFTGPILAFFIWLALTTAESSTLQMNISGSGGSSICVGVNSFFCNNELQKFIIVIGLLMGGLMMARSAGGALGQAAGFAERHVRRGLNSSRRWGQARSADIAVSGLARSNLVRNTLARVGGSTGVAGGIAAVTGLRAAATRAHIGLSARERGIEQQAQQYIGSISDRRILARIANSRPFLPWGRSIRTQARNRAPSEINNPTERQNHLNGMNEATIQNLSNAEHRRIGRMHEAGELDLFHADAANYRNYIQTHPMARGYVNTGANDFYEDNYGIRPTNGVLRNGVLRGLDRDHRPHPAGAGNPGDDHPVRPANPNQYKMTDQERASFNDIRGELKAGMFGRVDKNGEFISNLVQVDMNDLDVKELLPEGKDNFDNVAGINVENREHIAKIADSMMDIIDKKLHELKGKTGLSGDEEKRNRAEIRGLELARKRFEDPDKLNNLQLINSGVRVKDSERPELRRASIAHELIHGSGIKSEPETDKLEAIAVESEKRKKLKELKSKKHDLEKQILANPEQSEYMAKEAELMQVEAEMQAIKKAKAAGGPAGIKGYRKQSVRRAIEREAEDEANYRYSDDVAAQTARQPEVKESTRKIDTINNIQGGQFTSDHNKDLAFEMSRLLKAMNSLVIETEKGNQLSLASTEQIKNLNKIMAQAGENQSPIINKIAGDELRKALNPEG